MIPDVLPKLLIEIRADPAVAAIVEGRVRGGEPADGDAKGPGAYLPFVVLVQLGAARHPRVPVQFPRIAARCYGRTHQEAAALRWAVSGAVHYGGPRIHANGLGIYQSLDSEGGEQNTDPDTGQPYQTLVIEAPATTQVATA